MTLLKSTQTRLGGKNEVISFFCYAWLVFYTGALKKLVTTIVDHTNIPSNFDGDSGNSAMEIKVLCSFGGEHAVSASNGNVRCNEGDNNLFLLFKLRPKSDGSIRGLPIRLVPTCATTHGPDHRQQPQPTAWTGTSPPDRA